MIQNIICVYKQYNSLRLFSSVAHVANLNMMRGRKTECNNLIKAVMEK